MCKNTNLYASWKLTPAEVGGQWEDTCKHVNVTDLFQLSLETHSLKFMAICVGSGKNLCNIS